MGRNIDMPILNKYRLHPFGGYCKDYSHGEFERLVEEQDERRRLLTPDEKEQADKEYEDAYLSKKSDRDGR